MSIIREILILFGVCLAATAVSAALPVAVPASVLAMVLLFGPAGAEAAA